MTLRDVKTGQTVTVEKLPGIKRLVNHRQRSSSRPHRFDVCGMCKINRRR